MGEIADMMWVGTLCEVCGAVMDDLIPEYGEVLEDAPGYPRTCEDCIKFIEEQ